MIKEEVQFLRVAMGHDDESLDEFVEAHKTCLNDLMYFPDRKAYGLSSVAGNIDKLAALQNEFENVKKRMEDDAKKAHRLEQKIRLLTQGYQVSCYFLFLFFASILAPYSLKHFYTSKHNPPWVHFFYFYGQRSL